MEKRLVIVFFSLIFLVSCGKKRIKTPGFSVRIIISSAKRCYKIHGRRYYPVSGFIQRGIASWYGKEFHGKRTASGEIFNMYKRTAAHRTLPFGTYVLVRNLRNNRTTIVRINDRGPFVKNRIIDLSYMAAKDIGLIGPGTAPVEIVVLGREIGKIRSPSGKKILVEIKDIERGGYGVQVASFKNKKNALKLADRLSVIFKNVEVQVNKGHKPPVYRVVISGIGSFHKARKIKKRLKEIGFRDVFIIGP